MKEAAIILSYLLSAGILVLAAYFAKTNSGSPVRRAMALLSFSTGLWVLATTLGVYRVPDTLTYWTVRFTFVFGVLLVTALLLFCIEFPTPTFRLDRVHVFLAFVPVAIFSWILFATKQIFSNYVSGPAIQGIWEAGPLFSLYNVYLILLYVVSVTLLARKFSKVDGIFRNNLFIVFWSFLLGGAPGIINDLVLPFFTGKAQMPFIGTMSTIAWLGLTSYILVKK